MALTHKLDTYLTLERVMIELDERDDPLADDLRDIMDPLWYSLSPQERAHLNSRTVGEIRRFNPITLSMGDIVLPEAKTRDGPWEEIKGKDTGKRYSLSEVLAA